MTKEEALAFKEKGNKAFVDHKFPKAVEFYTQAIELDPENAVFFSNRAFCHIKMENFGSALMDASKAIELDPTFIKGYYRRGTAKMALFRYKEALRDFRQVAKIAPRDPDAQRKLKECEKAVRKAAFEEAIRDDREDRKISAEVDLNSMAVDPSYNGPRIGENGVDLDFVIALRDYQKDQKTLHKRYAYQILLEVNKVFLESPSLVDISIPKGGRFTVCGDIHGQYYDLLNIFEINGMPSETNPYLFNGDFVDRGSFSVEVIFLLFALKLCYPNHFFMARGNHESKNMNKMYGFEGEVKHKYDERMFELFLEVFQGLPLAHCIQGKVFCVHGGLFKQDDVTLDSLRSVDRFREPPDEGPMCDMLWSDPQPFDGRAPSKRGVGCSFGPDVTKKFLEKNGLELVIRSHEVKEEGYLVEADGKLVTVFSAPNYCDSIGNKGAFVILDDQCKPTFQSFDAVWHPPVKPMQYASGFSLNMLGI